MWHRHLHLKHLHLTCSQWWINEDLKINPQKVFLSIVQRWYFWNVSLGKTLRLLSLVLTEQQVQRTLTNILEVRVRVDWTDASVECMCSYNPASGESLVICDPVRSILKILEQNWENLAMVKKKTWFCLEARALVYTWLWWLGLGSLFPGGCCHSDPRENLLSKSKWYTFVFRTVINIFSYIKTRSRVVAWTLDTDPSLCPLQWVLWP